MAVELKTIQHLCELSKLNYDEAGLEKLMGEMSDIIPTDEDLARGFATIPQFPGNE